MKKLLFIVLLFSSCYCMKRSGTIEDLFALGGPFILLNQFNHCETIHTSDDLDDYFEVIKATIRLNVSPRTAYLLNCTVSWSIK